ncbi:hypothetical protein Tcan_08380 [Toxocara canis]|uniref:Uncharacterized protein n=1 Tax=Toxocara canis TaxID=6265 RepID=A0A0B2VSX1_TOXCA|nr:hypothetical protein Tcan_08380 [Toxocara canis]
MSTSARFAPSPQVSFQAIGVEHSGENNENALTQEHTPGRGLLHYEHYWEVEDAGQGMAMGCIISKLAMHKALHRIPPLNIGATMTLNLCSVGCFAIAPSAPICSWPDVEHSGENNENALTQEHTPGRGLLHYEHYWEVEDAGQGMAMGCIISKLAMHKALHRIPPLNIGATMTLNLCSVGCFAIAPSAPICSWPDVCSF